MNRTSYIKAACLLAITMTFGSTMAASNNAAVEMQRVEVAGQKAKDIARLDVKTACPAIAQELKSALRSTYDRHEANGVVRVQFRVQGDQVSAVTARGGPSEYRAPIRRTVYQLSCSDNSGADQLYAFELVFKPLSDSNDEQIVALLSK
jgi:hypothetical protein